MTTATPHSRPRTLIRALACLGLAAAAAPSPAQVAPKWGLCGGLFQLPPRPAVTREGTDPDAIELRADDADLRQGGISTLRGRVEVLMNDQILLSDTARYDKRTDVMEADGNVRFWEGDLYVAGNHAELDAGADILSLEQATFMDLARHGRGTAESYTRTGSDLIEVENATYSTCNPGDNGWELKTGKLRLDKIKDVGTARNVTVRFHGVPIFYSPYLTFPLSAARKSGFLVPTFRASGQAGAETTIPYYFNIAPNQDATLRLRATSERGTLLGGEYRYLTRRGAGNVNAEILPYDIDRGITRGLGRVFHSGTFAPGWSALVDFNRVSDRAYFEEFGNSLSVAGTTHLLELGQVQYSGTGWYAIGQAVAYQTVDRTIPGPSRPYQILPRLLVVRPPPDRNRRVNLGLTGDLANFERDASVTGQRLELRPTVTYPMRTAGMFLTPRLSLRYTQYNLDGRRPSERDNPSRLLPIASIDSGAFFERDLRLSGKRYVHTLEPRAFYLLVPFDNQDAIPVFDSGRLSFNFAQLFREDRFSGGDRIGDTHQLSLALTSRLLAADSGDEILRASVGQIRFFRNRKVRLPGAPVERDDSSDIVAEVSANVARRWRVSGGLQWDTQETRTDKSTISLRYQPDPGRVLNLSYRFVRDAAEQTDVSLRWPVNPSWSVVGRFNYALPEQRLLEGLGGVEYNSCCWAARAIFRRFLSSSDGDTTNSVFLQLELKGLAGIGRQAEALLEQNIPGFRNQF